MSDRDTALACLGQINPALLPYDEWLATGMALKDAGGYPSDWDAWSRSDKRYRPGECERKWAGFKGATKPVGIGSLVKLCRDHGGVPPATEHHDATPGQALAWDAPIGPREPAPDNVVVRQEWLQDSALPPEPATWDGREDFRRYLVALFQSDERVGIVTEAWQTPPDANGATRWNPKPGVADRTAGELLETLGAAKDLGEVIGDWPPAVGAWVRFNPLDGAGFRDENVTALRFALVECDDMPIDRQYAIYQQLELPVAALVHSGGRSLHAIVRIDAPDFKEYQKRVDFLYDVCKKNGLVIDRKNRNPSRLSRLPGATRDGRKQWLVATNVGKATWGEWADWIAAVNDDLPDVETLAAYLDNLPPLAETLIEGVLRQGHKMMLTGPSKAGKSFSLQQLAIGIAEGGQWMGWKCAQGRVLYVNLEIDRASCYHRLNEVYRALRIAPKHADDIDIWNLRGKAMAMDNLAPRLIRRAAKRKYVAIIIDPIYKVITGDENSADEMAKFCNQFDRICLELGAATIYCHHHSKGDQGQKRAHDRASGSGVFARDPDALLDMIELNLDEARRKQISNRWQCDALGLALNVALPDWRVECPQDDALVAQKLADWAIQRIGLDAVAGARVPAIQAAEHASGWRIEGILREFPTFKPRRCFFRYPVHPADTHGLLEDAIADGEEPPKKTREQATARRRTDQTADAWEAYEKAKSEAGEGPVTVAEMAARMHDSKTGELGISAQCARPRIDAAGFVRFNGIVTENNDKNDEK